MARAVPKALKRTYGKRWTPYLSKIHSTSLRHISGDSMFAKFTEPERDDEATPGAGASSDTVTASDEVFEHLDDGPAEGNDQSAVEHDAAELEGAEIAGPEDGIPDVMDEGNYGNGHEAADEEVHGDGDHNMDEERSVQTAVVREEIHDGNADGNNEEEGNVADGNDEKEEGNVADGNNEKEEGNVADGNNEKEEGDADVNDEKEDGDVEINEAKESGDADADVNEAKESDDADVEAGEEEEEDGNIDVDAGVQEDGDAGVQEDGDADVDAGEEENVNADEIDGEEEATDGEEKDGGAYAEDGEASWDVKNIICENNGNYLIQWAGTQPNGKPWPDTWEPQSNISKAALALYHAADQSRAHWAVDDIVRERNGQYLIAWAGNQPNSKKPWPCTWEPRESITEAALRDWEREAKKRRGKQISTSIHEMTLADRITDDPESCASGRPAKITALVGECFYDPAMLQAQTKNGRTMMVKWQNVRYKMLMDWDAAT
jgi:hypothetical protein